MEVISTNAPSVSITSDRGNVICTGTSVTFSANAVNAGLTPSYQWKKNGSNVGLNSSTYTANSLSSNDIISCVVTGGSTCSANQTAVSNNIVMSVNAIIFSTVTISSNFGNGICSGTNVTFTAYPVNGGATPAYQWLKNGIAVGTNSESYTIGNLNDNDIIHCVMSSSLACFLPDTSDPISMHVEPCVQLNLKLFIQGYYRGNGTMLAVVDPVRHPDLCDTISVELRSASPPFNIVYEERGTIDISGNGKFYFPSSALNSHFYIVIQHRNAIETWSNSVIFVNNSLVNYDFSLSASTAYGTNQAFLGDGFYALWSGDVTDGITPGVRDGIINDADHTLINNALQQFNTGYIFPDLTGDGIVESADFSLIELNYIFAITRSRP